MFVAERGTTPWHCFTLLWLVYASVLQTMYIIAFWYYCVLQISNNVHFLMGRNGVKFQTFTDPVGWGCFLSKEKIRCLCCFSRRYETLAHFILCTHDYNIRKKHSKKLCGPTDVLYSRTQQYALKNDAIMSELRRVRVKADDLRIKGQAYLQRVLCTNCVRCLTE